MYGYVLQYIVRPDDIVLSFGLGVYGLTCLAVVVLSVLRDPVWFASSSDMSGAT